MKAKHFICMLFMLLLSSSVMKAYNVRFYVNGQVYSETTAKSGQTITLTPPNREAIDCPFSIYFNGWSTNDDPMNPKLIKGDPTGASMALPTYTVKGDVNFYAMWNLGYDLVYCLDYYTVTIGATENGSISTTDFYDGEYFRGYTCVETKAGNNKAYKVLKGSAIALEATANEDYEFDSWSIGFNRDVQQSGNKTRIVVNSDGYVSAQFKEKEKAPVVDYTALDAKMQEASSYLWNDLLDDKYEEIRWTLSYAIEDAESLKTGDKTQAEIDEGVQTLANALTKAMNDKESIDNAEKNDSSKVDFTALDAKMQEASNYLWNELQEDKYEDIMWTLRNAIEEAESLKMFDRTQAEIDEGVNALAEALTKAMNDKKAIDDAPPVQKIDYSDLATLHNIVLNYYLTIYSESKYEEPVSKLYAVLIKSLNMYNNQNAKSQQEVNDLINELSQVYEAAKLEVAAIDNAGKSPSKLAFEAVYEEANNYYNEIYYDYSAIASSFRSEYNSAAMRVTWGGSVTDEEYDKATAAIEKALKKAKEAVAAAKVGYNEKELTDAISDAVIYYKGIVNDYAGIAATLAAEIEKANSAKANLTCQADVDNAVVDIQNALADAMAAVKSVLPSADQKQSLAFVTTSTEYSYNRKQYGYDGQGRIAQALGMSLNSSNNTWMLDTCYTYEYPDQYTTIEYAKTTHYDPEFVDGNPVYKWEWMHKKVTTTTATAKEVKLYYYDNYEDAWSDEASSTETTAYDEQGREVKIISDYNMKEIVYEGNRKTVTKYDSYGGEGSYTPANREATEKDENGNLLLKQSYNYINGEWMLGNVDEYKYSDDNVYLGNINSYYSNGEFRYSSDNTYTVERDAQGRITKKIKNNGGATYSTIEYNGYVATESIGSEKVITRVLDSEGNLMRYTVKEYGKDWNIGKYVWRTIKDVKYEYDKSVLAADVVGGMKYIKEPGTSEYEDDPANVSYKLKYALAKTTNNGVYDKTQNIYSLQPVTVKPATYDMSAAEPVITIPVATIVDKVECDEGAVVEIVDEAGNVVFEKKITHEDFDSEKGMFSDGKMNIQGFSKTYRKPVAHEFDEKKEEMMMSAAKGVKKMAEPVKILADATVIGEGRYFVQIAGGAVKVNGKPINQVMTVLNIGINDSVTGDVNNDGVVTREDAVMIMNYYLGMTVEGFNVSAADVDGDGSVTMSDANAVINICLEKK
ncbi:MAG: hypothetical protein KBT34_00510 [Prevotella sp.]|nr:hypothetical protein [Candidatus Prevotella equi]